MHWNFSYSVYVIIYHEFEFVQFEWYFGKLRIALMSPARTKHVYNLRWRSFISNLEKSFNVQLRSGTNKVFEFVIQRTMRHWSVSPNFPPKFKTGMPREVELFVMRSWAVCYYWDNRQEHVALEVERQGAQLLKTLLLR